MYGTFGEVTEKLFNSKSGNLRSDVREILLNNTKNYFERFLKSFMTTSPRKKILLIDEVDVFFAKDFFGQYYAPSINI